MPEIMITLQQIRDQSPCEDVWKKVFKANNGDMTKPFPMKSILDSNDLNDCLWALRCLPEHDNLWRLYAVWCARQVEHLMTDARSKAALDVAERFAKGDATREELSAARAAGDDAWICARRTARVASDEEWAAIAASSDAARAAKSACDASSDAARLAAMWAAWAAWAAAGAERVASAARDAERAAQKAKLIEILNAGDTLYVF